MKIYTGNSNMAAIQLSSDVTALEFRIKKATAAATLGDFFGNDTLLMTLNNNGVQENICPNQPLAMLAYYATMHCGFIKAIYDTTSTTKIKEVHFRVEVGYGGSVPLSDNRQLLISTNIEGLDSASGSLECFVISTGQNVDASGNKIPVAINCYDYVHMEPGNNKNIDVSNATTILMTTAEKDVTLLDRNGGSYVQSIESLVAVSRAVNEIAVMYGSVISTDKHAISGSTVSITKLFKAADIEPGGERYVGFGVSPYTQLQIRSAAADGILKITPKLIS